MMYPLVQRLAVRLVIIVGSGLLLFSSIVGALTYRNAYREQIAATDSLQKQLVGTVQAQAEVAVYASNHEIAVGVLDGLLANPLILAARIVGDEGFHSERGSRRDHDWAEPRAYRLYSPIDHLTTIGYIEIVRNDAEINRLAAQTAWFQTMLLLAEMMMAVFLLAVVLRWKMIAPITRLAHTLAHIQPGSAARIPLEKAHADDEIGLLTRRTNTMLDTAEQAVRVIAEREQAKSKFFAAASHDLRQPIHAIQLFLDALKRSSGEVERAHLIQSIETAAVTLNELLESLLEISKLDAGAIQPQYEWLNVEELFSRLDNNFSPIALQQRLRFKLWYPSRELALHTDRRLLNVILANLTGNALKNTARGGVLVGLRRRGDACVIQVWDTGCGIAAEHLAHIYDEFYQAANPGHDRKKGLGLGLAIARRSADLLGYRLDCRSQPGKGSVFEVRLPAGVLGGQSLPILGAGRSGAA